MLLALAILACTLAPYSPAEAVVFPLADTAGFYPYLFDISTASEIRFSQGLFAELLARSNGVRVTERGLQFLSPDFTMLDLTAHWEYQNCAPGENILCVTAEKHRFFPDSTQTVAVSDNSSLLTGIVKGMSEQPCSKASKRVLTGSAVYDVSLCNVVDSNYEIFFNGTTVFAYRYNYTLWYYVLICILTVFLVFCVTQNLTSDIQTGTSHINGLMCLASSWVLVLVTAPWWGVLSIYITQEDLYFYIFCVVYIFVNTIRWVIVIWLKKGMRHPFNVSVATLLLTSTRLYGSLENNYTVALIFLLCVRTTWKLYSFIHCLLDRQQAHKSAEHVLVTQFFLPLDAFLIYFSYVLGARQTLEIGLNMDMYFATMFFVTLYIGRFAYHTEFIHQSETDQSNEMAVTGPEEWQG